MRLSCLTVAVLVAAAAADRPVLVYYNVYAEDAQRSAEIVHEQLAGLRAAPIWDAVAEIRYSTVGLDEINGVTKKVCHDVNATCRHLGHHETGHEGRTLGPLHAFCVANPNATVAYIRSHARGGSRAGTGFFIYFASHHTHTPAFAKARAAAPKQPARS